MCHRGGGSLKAKLLNSFMAVVLVLGLAPISNSYAASSSDQSDAQGIEQQVDSSAENAESAEGAVSTEKAEDTTKTTKAAGTENAEDDTKAANVVSAENSENSENTTSSEGFSSQSGKSGNSEENSNDLTLEVFNPDADFVDISNNCNATVELFKDSSHSTPLGDTAIVSNEKFYAQLTVTFLDGYRPTLSNPNVMYKFPDNVKVADMSETNLQDGNTIAGTWYIENNVAYFKYNESYLKKTVLHAYASLSCELKDISRGDGSSETITFPGTSTSTTVYIKDGSVSASKFGGKMNETWNGPLYDQDDNSFTWTIKVSPKTYATNLVIEDTIGSNLSFREGSFKLVNASGEEVSGTCDVSINGQSATISLGDLAAGDYYVQYKTDVKSLPDKDNTAISDAKNTAKYSWGSEDNRQNGETSKSPQDSKYSMVSKSADGSSTSSSIKWVVKLNNGAIKADMGDYLFSDTLGDDQTFITSTGVTITDSDGNVITPVDASMTSSSLTFKLPSDAGEKQYTVTYYTQMTNTSSLETVKNTAELTPPDSDHGPAGTGTGSFTPKDSGVYITKSLTSDIDSSSYDGKASWKSEILFSDMSTSTNPAKIVFSDQFTSLPNDAKVSLDGDVTLTIGEDGEALAEGVDYTIEKSSGDKSLYSDLFKITFKDTDTVRALIGAANAKVVVSYNTQTTKVNDVYPNGTYKNKSSVKTDKKSTVSAEASYTIEKTTLPAVVKNGVSASWNADYEWADGTKGAWITDWTAYVNKTGDAEYQYAPAVDLGGQDVVVTDTLPADSEIIGKVQYSLKTGHWNPVSSGEVDAMSSDGVATITIPTAAANKSVYVMLTYQTATKGSVDTKDTITNTAQASSGSYEFPAGSDELTFDNKALSKTGSAVSGSSARKYTIMVNENAYDLIPGSDTLTLVDDIDYRGELSAATISVKSPEGIDLLASGQASYLLSKVGESGNTHTRLTLVVPDSMKVEVSYQVVPSGEAGDEMKDFSNTCELSGVKDASVNVTQTFNVATSSGGTASESWGFSITKYDSSGRKNLEGATFELWQIDLDESSAGNIVKKKLGEALTDASGQVSFGTEEEPLVSNVLYYFVETKAPAGYEISYTDPTYVMLKSEATKDGYQDAYDKAKALGFIPSSAQAYSAYDELSKGSFELNIEKQVEGAAAPEGATFTFHAEATGDNAASAPTLSDVAITTTGGTSTYSGTFSGSLSDSMEGETFTYKVSEVGSASDGWTYDSGTYTATVEVVEKDGKLVGLVTYYKANESGELVPAGEQKMIFTNVYKTSGQPILHVKKTVNSGDLDTKFKDKYFTVGVYEADSEGASTGKKLSQVQCQVGNTAFINDLGTYTNPGVYRYVLHEEGTPESGWTFAGDVLATVTATDNGKGTLDLSYEYSTYPDNNPDAALFDNTYSTSTSAKLSVHKEVEGATDAVKDKEFTFALYEQGSDEILQQVSAKDKESASFNDLEFTQAGEYKYVIKELGEDGEGWTYAAPVTATVNVVENADRSLSTTVSYDHATSDESAALFTNTYATSGTANIQVYKTVNGGTEAKPGEKFTFDLYKADAEGKATGEVLGTLETEMGTVASFDSLTFNTEGTYTYVIKETGHNDKGWTAASDVLVTVKASDNGQGVLNTEVSYSNTVEGAAGFDDTYSAAGELVLDVAKTINQGKLDSDQEFEFGLFETDAAGEKTGDPIASVSLKAGETKSLDGVFYDFDDDGKTYTYVISETSELGKGWTKAADQKVVVKVSDAGDGVMNTEISYEGGAELASFDNTYTEPEQPVEPDEEKDNKKEKADKSKNSDSKKDSTAKTGDDTMLVGGVLVSLAVAAAGVNVLVRRRRND